MLPRLLERDVLQSEMDTMRWLKKEGIPVAKIVSDIYSKHVFQSRRRGRRRSSSYSARRDRLLLHGDAPWYCLPDSHLLRQAPSTHRQPNSRRPRKDQYTSPRKTVPSGRLRPLRSGWRYIHRRCPHKSHQCDRHKALLPRAFQNVRRQMAVPYRPHRQGNRSGQTLPD